VALDLFRGVVPFVAVAEEKSFRKAAARLGVSAAAVSKAIRALEEDLGLSLLERNNRVVALTRQGEVFFERCRTAVASVEGARAAMVASRREPAGEIVLSAPFVVLRLLPPALSLLRSRYSGLSFVVRASDQLSRLAEESVDVAVRVGPLGDSSLVARRIRKTRLLTVASPAYLARRGPPASPADLAAHDCLGLVGPGAKPRAWWFSSGPLPVPASVLLDHGPTLVDAALAGLGITQAFDFMVSELLRDGRLVELFGALAADGPDIHAVCAPGRRATPNVKAAFHALADVFGAEP
jgi:LysR family transcriptional regulator for bpeEF and oprC